jgi:putative ABC transport system substrate-binding protein
MKRREFITLLGGAVAAWPLAARAQQQSAKVARIGFLGLAPAAAWSAPVEALRARLHDLGYMEGKNVVIEWRWAENVNQLSELATQLVHLGVDVIFAYSSTEVEAARQATRTIPIVFAVHADPVGIGMWRVRSSTGAAAGMRRAVGPVGARSSAALPPTSSGACTVTTLVEREWVHA